MGVYEDHNQQQNEALKMKYQKAIDIHELTDTQRHKLQIGQWVTAGHNGPLGVWCGMRTPSHTAYVKWAGNMKGMSKARRLEALAHYRAMAKGGK